MQTKKVLASTDVEQIAPASTQNTIKSFVAEHFTILSVDGIAFRVVAKDSNKVFGTYSKLLSKEWENFFMFTKINWQSRWLKCISKAWKEFRTMTPEWYYTSLVKEYNILHSTPISAEDIF